MPSLIVIALIGLAAQMVDGSLGMAYGVTSSTFLIAWGASPAIASASVHLAELGTTLVSGVSHWRFGNVDWKIVMRLGLPGAVGAFLGATVLSNISTEIARPWMSGLLMVLGAFLLVSFATGWVRPRSRGSRYLVPTGLVAGFVDATGGGGWGPVATPTMLIAGRTEVRKVVGSVSASEFLVAGAASAGFLAQLGSQGVDWSIAGALLAGGALAAPLAAWIVVRVPARVLGAAVGGLILVTNARSLLLLANAGPVEAVATYLVVLIAWVVALRLAVRGNRARSTRSNEWAAGS